MDLEAWSGQLKTFADATRVRLLALLEGEELTVAELSAITRLAQPRGHVYDPALGPAAFEQWKDRQLSLGHAHSS